MTVEVFRSEDYASADDGQDSTHAALFAHVGVTDPADWRAVALALAERYAPEALTRPVVEAANAKAGRPETRGPARMMALSFLIEHIREASSDGRVRDDLKSNRAICRFIAGKDPDAVVIRKMLDLPEGVSPRTIENLISKHQKQYPDLLARITYR